MKSNSLLLATLLLGIGLSIGYSLGRWQGNSTGETAPVSTGQQQQPSGKTTSSSDASTKHKRSTTSAEAPAATAKRLLDGRLRDKVRVAGDPVGRIHFQQALANCDEATLAGLMDEMHQFLSKDPSIVESEDAEQREWSRLLVQRMAMLHPAKALEALLGLQNVGVPLRTVELEMIFENLNYQGPTEVSAAIASMQASGSQKLGEIALMMAKVKTDPESVYQYLLNPENKKKIEKDLLWQVFDRLALGAPEKGLAALRAYKDISVQDVWIQDVMQSWIRRDPTAAIAHVMVQKEADLLIPCLMYRPSLIDQAAIRQSFSEVKSSDPITRQTLAIRLALNLAEQDIHEAKEWVSTLPLVEQTKANSSIAKLWIKNDPVAASEWLATWPAGEDKESAARALINKIQKDDPERAITWATNCLQGEERYYALASSMRIFAAKDPNAAATARAALSEEDRTALQFTESKLNYDPFASQ